MRIRIFSHNFLSYLLFYFMFSYYYYFKVYSFKVDFICQMIILMSEKGGNRDAMHLKRLTWSQGHGSDSSVSRLRFVHPESSIKSHIYTYIMLWFFAFAWEKNLLEDITMQDYAAGVTERTKDVTMMSGSKGSRDDEVKGITISFSSGITFVFAFYFLHCKLSLSQKETNLKDLLMHTFAEVIPWW